MTMHDAVKIKVDGVALANVIVTLTNVDIVIT